jgi:hypothetical protein
VVKTSSSTIPNSAFAVEVLTSQEEESREIPGSDGSSTEEGLWKVAPSLLLSLSLALEEEWLFTIGQSTLLVPTLELT